jgi:hypothetical protein
LKQGYGLLLEWIENARVFGDVEEPWLTVEIIHWLDLRRYEILVATAKATIASLYCDIFLDDPIGDPLKLCSQLKEIYLNSPLLLMEEKEQAVLDGILGYGE